MNKAKEDVRILLINPKAEREIEYQLFPIGLSYIAQALISEGYKNIQTWDCNVRHLEEIEFKKFIREGKFHIIGLTGLVAVYAQVRYLSNMIKEISPETILIQGGPIATAFPEIVLNNTKVDVVVLAEGESTIKDFANAIAEGKDLGEVAGICYKDTNGEVIKTLPRNPIKDLDSISFPNRDVFPFENYLRSSSIRTFQRKSRVAIMNTSRGCPYSCAYCYMDMWGHHHYYRSLENIIEEIRILIDQYGVDGINFVDDVFTLNRKHTMNFCEVILKSGIKIDWICSTRVNLVPMELLRMMKKAGCRTICYGIESGSQKVLDEMDKRVTVEQASEAVERTWDAGIIPYAFLMVGYFGETDETLQDTLRFCLKHRLTGSFSFPTPFPSTALFDRARDEGFIPHSVEWILRNWVDWTKQEGTCLNFTSISDERLIAFKKKAERSLAIKNLIPNLFRYSRILPPGQFAKYCGLRVAEAVNSKLS